MSVDWLIVALGNPGEEYSRTRHNVGWMVADALAAAQKTGFVRGKGEWMETIFRHAGKSIALIKPLTYMNRSGDAALRFSRLHSVGRSNIVCLVDEYNFPIGKVQCKQGGSDGGHNGLKSMIHSLGGGEFYRFRCGIDRKFQPGQMADYVLSDFLPAEQEALEAMIARSVEGLLQFVRLGPARGCQYINTSPSSEAKEVKPTASGDKI